MAVDLLYYRPWRGEFASPLHSVWPIARLALVMMFRRKLFWGLYVLALFIFGLHFFGQYLMFFAEAQMSQGSISFGGGRVSPQELVRLFRGVVKLNGTGETYLNFYWYQGYMVMIVLALAGALLIGNDIRHGSLPFYLSKPLGSYHYLLGKGLAVAVFINLMTTVPALVLYVQYGVLDTYSYFPSHWGLALGLLGFGALMTVVLTLLILATAVWLRRTVPLIMTWTTLFFFCRRLADSLVDRLNYDPRWKLLDLWNSLMLVGQWCLDTKLTGVGQQPETYEAAIVLTVVSLLCLTYLIRRVRAVEIVA